jgi:FkbM family methyltransferase
MLIKRLLESLSRPPQRAAHSHAHAADAIELPGFNQLVRGRHGLFIANRNDKYVGRSLIEYGEFSELEWHVLARYCRPGDVVAEVGANVGAHTVTLAKAVGERGRVIAVEPQPVLFQMLCANVALNCLLNVDAMNCGCSARADVTFVVPGLDYGTENNFGGIALEQARAAVCARPVRMEPLDRVLEGYQRLDLVKVDVEGMEEDVLASGAATIGRFRPVLYVENDRIEKSRSLIDAIRAMGYRMWWHAPPLFNPQNFFGNPRDLFPRECSFNMVCVPQERGADMPRKLQEVTASDQHPLRRS